MVCRQSDTQQLDTSTAADEVPSHTMFPQRMIHYGSGSRCDGVKITSELFLNETVSNVESSLKWSLADNSE